MRALPYYTLLLGVAVIAGFVAVARGIIPDPSKETMALAAIAAVIIGVKFSVTEAITGQFPISKTATDLSLTTFAAILSLALLEEVSSKGILEGPALFVAADPRIAAWILCIISGLIFMGSFKLACMARDYAKLGSHKEHAAKACDLASAFVGVFSFGSYLMTIFSKG